MQSFPAGFRWGASTAPHQVEGNNVSSDWWVKEGAVPGMDRSGDAVDSYHRYRDDMQLLAEAGFNSYRFGIEWARIEPVPGQISNAALAHYRRMIDTALSLGLSPMITLNHFTMPAWFADQGGWMAPSAISHWQAYVTTATRILGDVPWVVTINEPNMLAVFIGMERTSGGWRATASWQSPTVDGGARPLGPSPDPEAGSRLIEAHRAVRDIIRERTDAGVGWSVANRAFQARPGAEAKLEELRLLWEDMYLDPARDDDFVGVQAYSTQWVGVNGLEPHQPHPDNTQVGTPFRPQALEIAVRHTWERTGGTPIVVTENGIATADDRRRIQYTEQALEGLASAIEDGVDVRGYYHWSLLDNFEWGHWDPTFGLATADRTTFQRTPKPSLAWLGAVARRNSLVSE